jgi:hypothetical protein
VTSPFSNLLGRRQHCFFGGLMNEHSLLHPVADSALVAMFDDFQAMECAVRKIVHFNFDIKNISALGRGFHTEDDVVRSAITVDRYHPWKEHEENWGALWSLLFGGICINVPTWGPTIVVGQLAIIVATFADEAAPSDGVSCLGKTLQALGIHRDAVMLYENVLQKYGFLIVLHGTESDLARMRGVLEVEDSAAVHIHHNVDMRMLSSK